MQESTHRSASREKYDVIKNFPGHMSDTLIFPGLQNSLTIPGLWEPCVISASKNTIQHDIQYPISEFHVSPGSIDIS